MDNHGNDSTFMTLPWLIIAFTSFLFGTENFLDCSIGPDKFSMLTAPYKFSVFTVTDCILYDYSLTDRFVLTSVSVFTAIDFPVHYIFFDYILWLINSPWPVFGVNSHNKFSVFIRQGFPSASRGRERTSEPGKSRGVLQWRLGYRLWRQIRPQRSRCRLHQDGIREVQLYGYVNLCTQR